MAYDRYGWVRIGARDVQLRGQPASRAAKRLLYALFWGRLRSRGGTETPVQTDEVDQ